MGLSINDYLIEQHGINWPSVLSGWSWLLPPEFTLWLVTRFADLFLVMPDGTVHMLDVGSGTLRRVADSRDDFCTKVDEDGNANDWFVIPLVHNLVAVGIDLLPGHCYGFKVPPVLGGQYTLENVGTLPIADYLGAYASIHEQLKEVPDGTEIQLVSNRRAR